MDISTINRLVGGQPKANGIYRTIEACNAGGSISPDYEVEELEELMGFDGQLYFVDTFPHSIKYMQQPTKLK